MFPLSGRYSDYQMMDNYCHLNSHDDHYAILYKYMLYFITKLILGIYIDNNAIAGVPRPGHYYLYIYFSNAHPLTYEINLFKICEIYLIMILIRSQ